MFADGIKVPGQESFPKIPRPPNFQKKRLSAPPHAPPSGLSDSCHCGPSHNPVSFGWCLKISVIWCAPHPKKKKTGRHYMSWTFLNMELLELPSDAKVYSMMRCDSCCPLGVREKIKTNIVPALVFPAVSQDSLITSLPKNIHKTSIHQAIYPPEV